MMSVNKFLLSSGLAGLLVVSAAGTAGASMLVNLNTGTAAPTGTSGAVVSGTMEWNNLTENGTINGLIDTNGSTTSINVAESGATGGFQSSAGVNAMLYGYSSTASSASAPTTLTFSGLDATGSTTYNVYVYSWYDFNQRTDTTSITEAGGTLPAAQNNTYTGSESGTTFTQGVNYVLFSGLTANSGGDIQVSQYSLYGGAVFNGLQLQAVAVPEPASLGLVAMGGLGLLLIGRRRKLA